MTIRAVTLVSAKTLENSQTTQYTASNVTAIIDHCTATNYSGSAATVSVNIVAPSGSAANGNLIVKTKTLQPSETYTFPELVGGCIPPSGFISTIAGTASAINMWITGREVTQ